MLGGDQVTGAPPYLKGGHIPVTRGLIPKILKEL